MPGRVAGTETTRTSAIARLLSSFSRHGRDALRRILPPGSQPSMPGSPADGGIAFGELARALLSSRGEASGVAIAQDILALYDASGEAEKQAIFRLLAREFGPDRNAIQQAWMRYDADGDGVLPALANAVEAPRQELFRRLNLAPRGTVALVRMRADLLSLFPPGDADAALVDADMVHLLQSWFNRGFLEMRRIDWSSPARLLESVIAFEAVHHINGWDDLRNRLEPSDRRCYAFFHPAMPNDLLIFVEVALTRGMPCDVQDILTGTRPWLAAEHADTACFYSISNCQAGLRGISFGHFLIKQVAVDLQRELPNLRTFCTLSPVPGFMRWLRAQAPGVAAQVTGGEVEAAHLAGLAAAYLLNARNPGHKPLDPVARFHLGNGARLERIHAFADRSDKGVSESAGVMVNYLYDLPSVAENHEAFVHDGTVSVAPEIARLAHLSQLEPA